jgi:CRISPR-associated protein Cas5a/b/c
VRDWLVRVSGFALNSAKVSAIVQEIASQPGCWTLAIDRAAASGEEFPEHTSRIAAVGCGTSSFVAQAYAALREREGKGETDAFPASEFPANRSYDGIVAISRSGTTTEVLRILESIESPTVVITAVPDSAIVGTADHAVVLEFADERSVVQTRFATSTLAMLRAHLGQDLRPVVAEAHLAVGIELPIDPTSFDHYVFLGTGWTVGLAHEAALKMRETSGCFSESYPAMEYRHGPISLAGPRSVVWTLGDVDGELQREVAATGAMVVAGDLDPMAELIKVQRAAVTLAVARGLDPDHPRHLTRSVVLS